MQFRDAGVPRNKIRQRLLQNRLGLILVQPGQHGRRGPRQAGLLIGFADQAGGVQVPAARPSEDRVERDTPPRPVLAQQPRLRLADERQLVVIFGKERRLSVPHDVQITHAPPAQSTVRQKAAQRNTNRPLFATWGSTSSDIRHSLDRVAAVDNVHAAGAV